DIGCGWGPIVQAARDRGARAVGLTLSTKQAEACRRNGLEVHVLDWKDLTPDTFGQFDGIACIGAFEHFCSREEYEAGRQDEIYGRFFQLCHDLLPPGGRLYLQTMLWGPRFRGAEGVEVSAPRGSDERVLAVLGRFYPGSWLPRDADHVVDVARE